MSCPTTPQREAPATVPNMEAHMNWLVPLAVMSAMLLSRAKERLKTERVLPFACVSVCSVCMCVCVCV